MKGDNALQYQIERAQYLERTADQDAFLAFLQILGAKGPLDDLLVGAPIKDIEQQYAGEEGRGASR